MASVLPLLSGFVSSVVLTGIMLMLLRRCHWLDEPNHRSAHAAPVPTSGGIAFALAFLLITLWWYVRSAIDLRIWLASLLLLPLMLLGLVDDRCNLGIRPRLGGQLLVVSGLLLACGMPQVPLGPLVLDPGWWGFLPLILALAWFINLFNFMDGIDGIAVTEALFVALSAALFAWSADLDTQFRLALLLAGVCLGFAVFNLPPARLFMGDAGSNFLAGAILLLALPGIRDGGSTPWTWVILTAVFVTDATLTLISRMKRGEVWYHAHSSHAYQRAARLLGSHVRVLVPVALINVFWLLPLAWLSVHQASFGIVYTAVAYLPLALLWFVILRREQVQLAQRSGSELPMATGKGEE